MKPSEALAAHRNELRQLVSRYDLSRPRVFGSVLSGTDTDESDLDLLVDAVPGSMAALEHFSRRGCLQRATGEGRSLYGANSPSGLAGRRTESSALPTFGLKGGAAEYP